MSFAVADTIAALATARGPGARSIIRVSGPRLADCLRRCFGTQIAWEKRTTPTVIAGALRLTELAAELPIDLYFWPTNRSYTKQPSAELHLPGSLPLADAALAALCRCGARLARPGEFTMRAFLAGRIDLPQAEAVLGVIDATSQKALDRAIRQLAGGLSTQLGALRDQMLDLLADIEAGLDFVDDDIEFVSTDVIVARLTAAADLTVSLLGRLQSRATHTATAKAVLLGLPNVGKSRLFNTLCSRQAIVSEKSGTTRDYVEGPLVISDDSAPMDCIVVDTAGVAEAGTDIAPLNSQEVTQTQWNDADLLVLCLDASRALRPEDIILLRQTQAEQRLVVWTKTDLLAAEQEPPALPMQEAVWLVSSATGQGVRDLIAAIGDRIHSTHDEESQVVQSTAQRCRASLQATLESFESALMLARESAGDELLAAELRAGLDHLGQIAGTVYTEDVLDRIFGRFCIGK